jgi:signal-transduction protein with cAMP-binding, CBS, and nucleotidyltransferase domain
MADRQIRRLLVTEGNRLVGIVSLGDVAIKDSGEDKSTGQVLEDISEPAK